MVFDKAHHVLQGIAQKHADFMGKFPLQAQPPGQLPQQALAVLIRLIPLPCQKGAVGWLREDRPEPSGPVQVDQTSTRLRTVFQDPDGDAVRGQLLGPAGRGLPGLLFVSALLPEQTGRLHTRQRGCALFYQHRFKAPFQGSPSVPAAEVSLSKLCR